jgi:hypothetical protein
MTTNTNPQRPDHQTFLIRLYPPEGTKVRAIFDLCEQLGEMDGATLKVEVPDEFAAAFRYLVRSCYRGEIQQQDELYQQAAKPNPGKAARLLAPLDEVDYCAEIWGQYLGGFARAALEQYRGQLYSVHKDSTDIRDIIADFRKGFDKAFSGLPLADADAPSPADKHPAAEPPAKSE